MVLDCLFVPVLVITLIGCLVAQDLNLHFDLASWVRKLQRVAQEVEQDLQVAPLIPKNLLDEVYLLFLLDLCCKLDLPLKGALHQNRKRLIN
jgi:hypothetical protein